jgi:hypothetical protein
MKKLYFSAILMLLSSYAVISFGETYDCPILKASHNYQTSDLIFYHDHVWGVLNPGSPDNQDQTAAYSSSKSGLNCVQNKNGTECKYNLMCKDYNSPVVLVTATFQSFLSCVKSSDGISFTCSKR